MVGRNLLLAYLIPALIPLESLVNRLVGGDVAVNLGAFAPWASAFVEVGLIWIFLYWLYRNRIAVRL